MRQPKGFEQGGLVGVRSNGMDLRQTQAESVRLRGLECRENLLLGRLRQDREDEVHGVVFEDAGGLALRVADDLAPFGCRGLPVDAGELEREGVGQRHVTVEAGDEDRVVGAHAVDPLFAWQLASPGFVIPVAVQDPTTCRLGRREFGDAPGEEPRRRCVAQLDAGEGRSAFQKVHVVVDEARHGEAAREIDRLFRRDPGGVSLADKGNHPLRDGHGCGLGQVFRAGPDHAVDVEGFGPELRVVPRGVAGAAAEDEKRGEEGNRFLHGMGSEGLEGWSGPVSWDSSLRRLAVILARSIQNVTAGFQSGSCSDSRSAHW